MMLTYSEQQRLLELNQALLDALQQAIEDGYNNACPATWDQMLAAVERAALEDRDG